MTAKFGSAGNPKRFYDEGNKSTLQAPAWIAKNGLDAYEYQGGNGIFGNDSTFAKIGEQAKLHNIKMSLHSPYYISLSSVDEEKRVKSVEYIGKCIHTASLLGAKTIVIHCGSASKISREQAVIYAKETLSAAIKIFEPILKSDGIILGIETMGKINQLGNLDEVVDICKISEFLAPVVDFGHLNARNIGNLFLNCDDYLRVFDKIANELSYDHAKNLHCHFSKIEYTAGGEKKHLTLEDQVFGPPFEPLCEVLAREKLTPTIICESDEVMADDAMIMKNYYNSLIN